MILDDVKTALRISHNKLDSDLASKIIAAKREMVRVGINSDVVESASDALIVEAIKTYCAMTFTDDVKEQETLHNSFVCQLDGMRKSSEYRGGF